MAIGTPVNLLATDPAGIADATTGAAIVGTVIHASTNGNLIIATAVLRTANTPTACTFTDSHGLTWTTAKIQTTAGSGAVAIGWAVDTVGKASGTITATFDVTGTRRGLTAHSVPGLATTTPVDTAVTAGGGASTGTPSATAAGASTQASELFVGASRHNTSAGTDSGTIVGTGWVEDGDFVIGASTFLQHYAGYKIASATETPVFTFTPTVTTTAWNAAIVAFKAAAGGSTTNQAGLGSTTLGAAGVKSVSLPRLAATTLSAKATKSVSLPRAAATTLGAAATKAVQLPRLASTTLAAAGTKTVLMSRLANTTLGAAGIKTVTLAKRVAVTTLAAAGSAVKVFLVSGLGSTSLSASGLKSVSLPRLASTTMSAKAVKTVSMARVASSVLSAKATKVVSLSRAAQTVLGASGRKTVNLAARVAGMVLGAIGQAVKVSGFVPRRDPENTLKVSREISATVVREQTLTVHQSKSSVTIQEVEP